MHKQNLLVLAGLSAVLTVVSVLLFDQPLAEWMRSAGVERLALFDHGTSWLDMATGKEVSKFLIGFLLLGIGLFLSVLRPTRAHGFRTLYVGAVQLLATLIAGVSKNLFGRLRPYELLQSDTWTAAWHAGGSAFPSGHTAFYFGLFLPLVYLFPRWRWPLLFVPVFIGLARINANDHFLSDVTASIALVALLAWFGAVWLGARRQIPLATYSPLPFR